MILMDTTLKSFTKPAVGQGEEEMNLDDRLGEGCPKKDCCR